MSDYYAPGFKPTEFNFTINPATDPIINSTWEATYTYEGSTATYEYATIEFRDGGIGVVTERLYQSDGTTLKGTNIYNFTYSETNSGRIEASVTSVSVIESGFPITASSYTIYFEYLPASNMVGIALYFVDSEGYIYDIFGLTMEDEEGFVTIENLDGFTKVAA